MTISRWSANKIQQPLALLINIAKVLSVTLVELVEAYKDQNGNSK